MIVSSVRKGLYCQWRQKPSFLVSLHVICRLSGRMYTPKRLNTLNKRIRVQAGFPSFAHFLQFFDVMIKRALGIEIAFYLNPNPTEIFISYFSLWIIRKLSSVFTIHRIYWISPCPGAARLRKLEMNFGSHSRSSHHSGSCFRKGGRGLWWNC